MKARWIGMLFCALTLPSLYAQAVICIPPVSVVPALHGHPTWWDADGDNAFPELVNPPGCSGGSCLPEELVSLHDPRWIRAVSNSGFDPAKAGYYGDFRALFSGDSVYFSWQAPLDVNLVSGSADAVWFAIRQKTDNSAIAVRFRPTTIATARQDAFPWPTDGAVYYDVTLFDFDRNRDPQWKAIQGTTPAWITTRTRVWTEWEGGLGSPASWAFQVVVPRKAGGISAGLDFDVAFDMWYSIVVDLGSPVGVAYYQYPSRGVNVGPTGANLPNPDVPTDWGDYSLGVPATPGTSCAGDVSLEWWNVFTGNTPTHEIKFTHPGSDPDNRAPSVLTNTFYALPKNERLSGPADLNAGDVKARFYLANWGTQANWNDINNSSDQAEVWRDITPANPPGNLAAIEATHTATMTNGIRLDWPPIPDCDRYDYLPDDYPADCPAGTKRRIHECMLVEMFSDQAGLTFRNKSVYRNMDIVPASKFARDASVSVVGLEALPGAPTQRDVYLFVEIRNMPKSIRRQKARDPLSHTLGAAGRRPTEVTTEQVDSIMPTYRIHAWHTTGDSVGAEGDRRAVVRSQTSFGYWVTHDGELQGWRHQLTGASLTPIGPNLYRVAVPQGGVSVVTTRIYALEPPRNGIGVTAGVSTPLGSLNTTYDGGIAITGDLERRLSATFNVAALFGFLRFDQSAGTPLEVMHISASLEAERSVGRMILIAEAGGGRYRFDPGATGWGGHLGAAIQFELTRHVRIGGVYRRHAVSDGGSTDNFGTTQGGLRVVF